MFKFRIAFPGFRAGPKRSPRPRTVSDDHFRRKIETSQILQHMCGFDNELYAAINGLDMNGMA